MVFDGVLVLYPHRLFNPRGPVNIWAQKVTRDFAHYARQEAPLRSGHLKASISGDVDRFAPTELSMTIGASAEYAIHVLGGTPAQEITDTVVMWNEDGMTKQGQGQRSPIAQSTFNRKHPRSVVPLYVFNYNMQGERNWIAGSPAQNFLARAYHRTAGKWRSIGGWSGIDNFFQY